MGVLGTWDERRVEYVSVSFLSSVRFFGRVDDGYI